MTLVACRCPHAHPHGAHFYLSFIAGGNPGPVPSLTCICPGWTGPVIEDPCPDCGLRTLQCTCVIPPEASAPHA